MPTYNKLVRDKILDIIKSKGQIAKYRQLEEREYHQELKRKLQEEVNEYLTAEDNHKAIEELADILEVIYALASVNGHTMSFLNETCNRKRAERGGFENRILLIEVENK